MTNSKRYDIFITRDGSPTLEWRKEDGYVEKMHHSGGALSESLFIYQECLKRSLEAHGPIKILSLGLGLGYNEIIAIGTLYCAGLNDWKIWSFELDDFLRNEFHKWLKNGNSELAEVYEQILEAIARELQISSASLKELVVASLQDGRLELRGGFPEDAGGVEGCTCVFYDAFSKKMDPNLWAEETLASNLAACISSHCVLATYAATGALNRALKFLGFRLLPRAGFQGKRESTLAIRDGS